MANNDPSFLTTIKANGRYGCRDCDYVSPYRSWRNSKKDVKRHWQLHHATTDASEIEEEHQL